VKGEILISKIVSTVVTSITVALAAWLVYDDYEQWANPEWLWALLVIPALTAVSLFWGGNKVPRVKASGLKLFGPGSDNLLFYLRDTLVIFRMIALATILMALARPQMTFSEESQTSEGIDIVLAMDLSSSMLAQDFKPNRLAAAKETAIAFVKGRPTDRFGLVAYAGVAQTLSPLTTDHAMIQRQLASCDVGLLSEDGTALGLGLGYAVNRLRESEAPSKVIILLTDGVNNIRAYPPMTFAQTAKQFGARVYTIGVGSMTTAKVPVSRTASGRWVYDTRPVEIDEKTLTEIADLTGGKYFRADNIAKLKEIYREIDKLEKIKIETNIFIDPQEEFLPFVLIALAFLFIEFVLRHTLFRSATS
jgi:Ca-activated chloride channel family protein